LREIKEQMGVGGGAPTNALSHGHIAGTKEAGDQPPVDLRKKRNWNPFFKDLARVQRRKLSNTKIGV